MTGADGWLVTLKEQVMGLYQQTAQETDTILILINYNNNDTI